MRKENIKGTVIIVEDDMILSLVMSRIVENLGFKVVANADNGDEAIKQIKEYKPDVVVMNVSLKGSIDGIETVSRICSFSNAPVIYVTGHSDKHHITRAQKTGFIDYLLKPISQGDMVVPLEKAIQKCGEYHIN